jgi:chemotaxis protein MotB
MRWALPLLLIGSAGCLVPQQQLIDQQRETESCYDALGNENQRKRDLASALERLQTAVDELSAERKRLAAEKGSLEGDLAKLEADVGTRLQEIRKLTDEKSKLEQERAALAEKTQTYDDLVKNLQVEMKQKLVEVKRQGQRITVNVSDQILFDSGSAEVKASGRVALDKIAEVLAKVADRRIDVEGHTDDLPISGELTKLFPSNWELSAARATTVVRFLEEKGVNPTRLAAVGKSKYRPVARNNSPQGRQLNRRIEIVLTPWDGKS